MTTWLVVSNVVLWLLVIGLALLVFALTRQIGVLYERVAPAGALMVNQQLKVGDAAPEIETQLLSGEPLRLGGVMGDGSAANGVANFVPQKQLLFFLAPDCPICKSLLPVLKTLEQAEKDVRIVLASDGGELQEHLDYVQTQDLGRFPYVLSEILGRSYGVSKLPYAVLIAANGTIASLGIVNSREHLESLFVAEERGVGSIQEYLAGDSV